MDIGHLRHIRWHKANDKDKWIAYNKQRGQHASAMEHATPEQFWVDKKQCRYTDENGQVQNPSLNACAQAVSAVKAIQIAASQGQKVYTVNASNASAALAASGAGGEIKEAIQAGMEVTFHERSINAHGWSGTGYSIVDPETGVGSYLIEGKGNGAVLVTFGVANIIATIALLPLLIAGAIGTGGTGILPLVAGITAQIALSVGAITMGLSLLNVLDPSWCKTGFGIFTGTVIAFLMAVIGAAILAASAVGVAEGVTATQVLVAMGFSGHIARVLNGFYTNRTAPVVCPT